METTRFEFNKIKACLALLTGGLAGLAKYGAVAFNVSVLGNIKDKGTALLYLKDVQALMAFVKAVLDNHKDRISEKKKEASVKVLDALDTLACALADFEIGEDELEDIIESIEDAITALKRAK